MKVYLREISEEERELYFTEKDPWLANAVEQADESPYPPGEKRPIKFILKTKKVDDVLWIEGEIQTKVSLICSRSGSPFLFDCTSHWTRLFTQNKSLTDTDEIAEESIRFCNVYHSDSEINFLTKDFIEVDPLVTEGINLEIPLQPINPLAENQSGRVTENKNGDKENASNNPFAVLKHWNRGKLN